MKTPLYVDADTHGIRDAQHRLVDSPEDNAALVHAANHYDDLVAALQQIATLPQGQDEVSRRQALADMRRLARAALADAGEGTNR